MKAETKRILADIKESVLEINTLAGTAYSLEQMGEVWFIRTGENTCLNGHWTESSLLRLYDQTEGYLRAIIEREVKRK